MKKPIIVATVLAACLASQAFAQANNFQGFSLGLGVNVANTKAELVSASSNISGSDTDNNAVLQLQYNFALGDSFVLGVGATANLGDRKAGSSGAIQAKEKDAYSLYLAPGYAFSSNMLGYVKLSSLNAKLTSNVATWPSANFDDGFGFGLGLQSMFSRNWFGQAEYMNNQYSDRRVLGSTVKLKSDVITLTAGYKF